ncbi:MAG: transcriptional regulator [Archangium gephyra]|uniref:Transcriptional regulator n=1 Tax=Archangium gephyra TaxID=48 RepID=A0A2W5TI43_9BACT|nr:MAG: transcriptional regulator [Archangium gephyra]
MTLLQLYAPGASADDPRSAAIDALLSASRAQWPLVKLADDRFVLALKKHAADGLETVRGPDLFLATACLAGDPAALAALDEQVIARIDKAVAGIDSSRAFLDEVQQLVRERLLVGAAPRLAEYSGKGALVAWARTVALRLALNLRRDTGKETPHEDEALEAMPFQGRDLELDYVRSTHRADFTAAFADALASLDAKDRNLLRLSIIDRLSVDQIGAIYGAHRATAARWVNAARDALLERTRKNLAERLKLTGSELQSLLGALQSNLEISLNRMLRE